MTVPDPRTWPAAGRRGSDVEHAVVHSGSDTLCGLPARRVTVYRHLFRPDGEDACPACRDAARR